VRVDDQQNFGKRLVETKNHFPYRPWDDCIFTYMKTIKIKQMKVNIPIPYMDPMGSEHLRFEHL